MWVGLVALLTALAVAGGFALYRHRVDGRFRAVSRPEPGGTERIPDDPADLLTAADLGVPLGRTATVVQFSSEFCAPCRAAERVITDVVDGLDGVDYVDLDSEQKLDLIRRFNILRTPTVVVTDAGGRIVARTAGVPTKQALISVLPVGAQP
jgi:thiol-disulfide isomerase/thioredoxin